MKISGRCLNSFPESFFSFANKVRILDIRKFPLDASSHALDIETESETILLVMIFNGKTTQVLTDNLKNDTIIACEDYSVQYVRDTIRNVREALHYWPVEIIGEWFSIKKPYPSSEVTHIFIDKNNEDIERNIIIKIGAAMTHGDIIIKQKRKN